MGTWRGLVQTVHLVALALWLGTLVAAGTTAAVVFPTMRQLDARLPGYERATEQHRIAAGMVAQRVFVVADLVQFPCALAAAGSLAIIIIFPRLSTTRPSTIIRCVSMSLALAALAALLIVVTPALTRASQQHWRASKDGDTMAAATHRSAVDDLHPLAERLSAGMALAVFIALAAGTWSLAVPPPTDPAAKGSGS